MAMDPSRYPADWPEIRQRILRRAGGQEDAPQLGARCEWCQLENYAYGYRLDDSDGSFVQYGVGEDFADAKAKAAELQQWKREKVIVIMLTTAHIGVPHADGRPGDPHDKRDCRDENLAALCQKCHLNHDRREHIYNAAVTRRRRRIEAGQLEMELVV